MKGEKMTGQPLPPRRRRGGQPGNTNALKHGLFSRRINPADLYKLGANPGYAANRQIAQLRLYLRELLDRGPHIEDFGESLILLKNINIASGVLTRLISQRCTLKPGQSDPQAAESLIIAKRLIQEYRERQKTVPPDPPLPDPLSK
jgi:hypothetical protein